MLASSAIVRVIGAQSPVNLRMKAKADDAVDEFAAECAGEARSEFDLLGLPCPGSINTRFL